MRVSAELEAAETNGTPPSPEAIAAIINFYTDFLTALDSSPTVFEGFSCEGTDPQGKSFMLAAGPANIGGFKPGIYPAFALDNFAMEAEDGWFRLGNFTWKAMDLGDALENLADVGGELNEEWLEKNWRFIVPQFEGFSLAGLAMDVPGPDEGTNRIEAEVAALDLSLSDYVNGIPSAVASSASGVAFAVPDGEDGAALRALGLERLSLGYGIDARWNRDQQTITLEQLSLTGNDLGSIRISGTIANAGPELFSERNE